MSPWWIILTFCFSLCHVHGILMYCGPTVNGNWGSWFRIGPCSASCDAGIQQMARLCDNPHPSDGGADCMGQNETHSICHSQSCPSEFQKSLLIAWYTCSILYPVACHIFSLVICHSEFDQCAQWTAWSQCVDPCVNPPEITSSYRYCFDGDDVKGREHMLQQESNDLDAREQQNFPKETRTGYCDDSLCSKGEPCMLSLSLTLWLFS